jgi:gliding motility-associated-like protein
MKTIGLLLICTFWCAITMGQATQKNTITVKKPNPCFENNLRAYPVFTPNGDGVKDEFLPLCLQRTDLEFKFKVVDREMGLMFETTASDKPWKGNDMNSKPAAEGIYSWTAVVVDQLGEKHQFKGEFELIR